MISVIQRVSSAAITVDSHPGLSASFNGHGLVVLAALVPSDTDADLAWTSEKLVNLRIFPDDHGKMNRSLLDIAGDILLVSNFTLAADASRGRRPSFDAAMPPTLAQPAFARFVELVRAIAPRVHTGVFGAHMSITLTNDGPITLVLNSNDRPR